MLNSLRWVTPSPTPPGHRVGLSRTGTRTQLADNHPHVYPPTFPHILTYNHTTPQSCWKLTINGLIMYIS